MVNVQKIVRNACYVILGLVLLHFFLRMYTTFAAVRSMHIKRRQESIELLASDFCKKSRVFVDCAAAETDATRVDYFYLHALEETLGILLKESSSIIGMKTKETFYSVGILGMGLLAIVTLGAVYLYREYTNRLFLQKMYEDYNMKSHFRESNPKRIVFKKDD